VMFTQSFSVVRASFSSIQFALGLISITSIGWGWDAIPLSKPLRLSPQPSCARIPLVSSKASKLIRQRNQGQIERQHPTEDIQKGSGHASVQSPPLALLQPSSILFLKPG